MDWMLAVVVVLLLLGTDLILEEGGVVLDTTSSANRQIKREGMPMSRGCRVIVLTQKSPGLTSHRAQAHL
jgi:hypothetical protein